MCCITFDSLFSIVVDALLQHFCDEHLGGSVENELGSNEKAASHLKWNRKLQIISKDIQET